MCGICGRVNLRSRRPVSAELISRMTRALAHRGPDGERVWVSGCVGLGHRRLAVVDLTDRAMQPASVLNGHLIGVFNGELYNAAALREQLRQRGAELYDRGEMELILWAYELFGSSFLDHLDGMFALAIWDDRIGRLTLARDRFGKKPLFYHEDAEGLTFSSSLAGLHESCKSACDFDPVAIDHFLSLNYIPSPMTGLKDVYKLPPGTAAVYDDTKLELASWYVPVAESQSIRSLTDAEVRLVEFLDRAVEKRLRSDVAVGLFLSSGLDSAAVLSSLCRLGVRTIPAFTASFAESRYDESNDAERLARHFNCEHRRVSLSPSSLDDTLHHLVQTTGEPIGDSSLLPTWQLAHAAREQVTVILNGDGGDECFGGYHRHLASHWVERMGLWGLPVGSPALIPEHSTARLFLTSCCGHAWSSRVERLLQNLSLPLNDQYIRWMLLAGASESRRLRGERLKAGRYDDIGSQYLREKLAHTTGRSWLERILEVEWHTYLSEDLLVKMDRACMAHGLEPRSPFLDHELVRFARSLPVSWKIRGLTKKWLLRRALQSHLPEWALRLPKKGFGAPIDIWLRTPWKNDLQTIFNDSYLVQNGWVEGAAVSQLVREHLEGTRNHAYRLWNLLILETWMKSIPNC